MVGGLNRLLPKEINANRFFWDSHWLMIGNLVKPLLSLYGTEWREPVAIDSESVIFSTAYSLTHFIVFKQLVCTPPRTLLHCYYPKYVVRSYLLYSVLSLIQCTHLWCNSTSLPLHFLTFSFLKFWSALRLLIVKHNSLQYYPLFLVFDEALLNLSRTPPRIWCGTP